ncbi:cyanobactin maturation protease PatG family protein [Nocardia sp. NPDC001965]
MEESDVSKQDSAEFSSGRRGGETTPARQPAAAADPVSARAAATCGCGSCGDRESSTAESSEAHPGFSSPYVYALGRIEPRLGSLGIEKEFAQATGRAATTNLTDREALHAVLSDPQNRYLARLACYVFTIQGLETYIVRPRDPTELTLLIDALSEASHPTDLHLLIGLLGGLAPESYCNGLVLPVVAFDQIYAFDTTTLVQALPKPEAVEEERFRTAAQEIFDRVMQLADNAGSSDEHRALNYLVARYPSIYAKSAESFASGSSVTAIETRPSRLGTVRNILDVIFSYTNRATDVTEKFFVRVDVTEEFPFLVTKLSPYYDR